MNPISLQGRYRTRSGDPVRILCVDAEGIQPVIGLHLGETTRWSAAGVFGFSGKESVFDLIEVSPTALEAAARKVIEARANGKTPDDVMWAIDELAAALENK